MEIQKVFSNVEDDSEVLYSCLMSEEELKLFALIDPKTGKMIKSGFSGANKATRRLADLSKGIQVTGEKYANEGADYLIHKGRNANRFVKLPKGAKSSVHDRINMKQNIIEAAKIPEDWVTRAQLNIPKERTKLMKKVMKNTAQGGNTWNPSLGVGYGL